MINVKINDTRVSYETLEEAQEAADAGLGLTFWRETLEACAADNAVWNDFLNELWQNGGEREAEVLDQLFNDKSIRSRWILPALVLKGWVAPSFAASIKEALDGSYQGLIDWLQARRISFKGSDANSVEIELKYWQGRQGRIETGSGSEPGCVWRRESKYMVVDLLSGENATEYSVSYLADIPAGGWTNEYKTTKLVLRRVEPGSFMMGSSKDEANRDENETQHQINLTRPYYIGVFQVTQKQWRLIRGKSPSSWDAIEWPEATGDEFPVMFVTYNDIRGAGKGSCWPLSSEVDDESFMGRLRTKTGVKGFDLPTEAQWECACRAGTTTRFSFGDSVNCDYLWCQENSCNRTHVVGLKKPNGWGLYDMHGNVWEWCLDWYGPYGVDPNEPRGRKSGDSRIQRGGGWVDSASWCRSATRMAAPPDIYAGEVGFRLCFQPPTSIESY